MFRSQSQKLLLKATLLGDVEGVGKNDGVCLCGLRSCMALGKGVHEIRKIQGNVAAAK